jgi:hypothetical protein
MAVRRQHSDAEIAALAEQFRQSWSAGQIIRSWLRAHGDELVRLVRRDDWAWVNLGRALSLAGIAYRTGKPWTGENLRRAVALAQKPLKRAQRIRTVPPDDEAPAESRRGPDVELAPEQSPLHERPEPEFRIIRKVPVSAQPPASPAPPRRAAARPDLGPDEILAIAAGQALKR